MLSTLVFLSYVKKLFLNHNRTLSNLQVNIHLAFFQNVF